MPSRGKAERSDTCDRFSSIKMRCPQVPFGSIANRRFVRGVPELESADDYTIACAIAGVNRRYQRRIVLTMLALALLLMALLMSAMLFLDDPLGNLLGFAPGAWYHSPLRPILFILMCLGAAAGVWGIIRVSRAQRRYYLRREAAANEARSVCTRCRYDLSALREQGAVVTCPECGMANRFDSWTEGYAALIAKKGASHTPPPATPSTVAETPATKAAAPAATTPAPPVTSPAPSPPPRSV
jgi:hypothetical protein